MENRRCGGGESGDGIGGAGGVYPAQDGGERLAENPGRVLHGHFRARLGGWGRAGRIIARG